MTVFTIWRLQSPLLLWHVQSRVRPFLIGQKVSRLKFQIVITFNKNFVPHHVLAFLILNLHFAATVSVKGRPLYI